MTSVAAPGMVLDELELAHQLVALDAQLKAIVREAAAAGRAGLHVDERDLALALGERKDQLSEVFRRRFYPRAHRVVATSGSVFAVSRTGRSIRRVYDEGACRCGDHGDQRV